MKEYTINNVKFRLNTFEHIRDFNDAYLIGYLCGDGGFAERTKKKLAKIAVSSSDKEIIDWMQNNYCPDSKISSIMPINKKRPEIISKKLSYRLPLSSKFSDTFDFYKILCKKTDRDMVNIPNKYFKAYLLGLFDADGHCSWGKRKDRNRLWVNIGITHQSENLLIKVQAYLTNVLNIASSVKRRKDENCLDLKFSNRDNAKKFLLWLYSDNMFSMNRKRVHSFDFIKEYDAIAT